MWRITHNGLGYEQLRELALNFASTHQTENPRGFSEEGEYKQLFIAIVVKCTFYTSIDIFTFPPRPFSTMSNNVFKVKLLPLFSTLEI